MKALTRREMLASFVLFVFVFMVMGVRAETHDLQLLASSIRIEPNDLTTHSGDADQWTNNSNFHSVDASDTGWHRAEPAGAGFEINQGISASWFNASTAGQGFLIEVRPLDQFIFVAWFTFDLASTKVGSAGQRWLIASGHYQEGAANLRLFSVSGGSFVEAASTMTEEVGTLSLEFSDCENGLVDYDLGAEGLQGQIVITRAVPDNIGLCETLAGLATHEPNDLTIKSGDSDRRINNSDFHSVEANDTGWHGVETAGAGFEINQGISASWFDASNPGQGFLMEVRPLDQFIFVAWFTFDLASTKVGAVGQRWLIASGHYQEGTADLRLFSVSGGSFVETPSTMTEEVGALSLEFSDCENGLVDYDLIAEGLQGQIVITRAVLDNTALCETLAAPAPVACIRPDPDLSHGLDNPPIVGGATVPTSEVLDGGPGPDGIPPLETPQFTDNLRSINLDRFELVVGVKIGNDIRAYPHNILNWHEVVNDQFAMNGSPERATLSYCPLTGSAMLWKSFMEPGNETFGTSGLLYNSNLVMYDRATISLWSQMLEQSIAGPQVQRIPDRLQVVETTWRTWQDMYPETSILTEQTGFSRPYDVYPYGSFREDQNLIFPANNSNDNRLHRKERVLGINVGTSSKVYPISQFSSNVEAINDTVGDLPVVAVGSSGLNFGVVFNRELEDCTVLDFEAVQGQLPIVMRDNEGNEWDVFGTAVSGSRTGQQLQKTNSYISYWYAWTAFFPGAEIHQ